MDISSFIGVGLGIAGMGLTILTSVVATERYVAGRFEKLSREIDDRLDRLNNDLHQLKADQQVFREYLNGQMIRLDAWSKSLQERGDSLSKAADTREKVYNARYSGLKDDLQEVQLFMAKNFSFVIRKRSDRG